jgi:hypothetical protein
MRALLGQMEMVLEVTPWEAEKLSLSTPNL